MILKNKFAQEMSLKFLINLIFAAFLIFATFYTYGKIVGIDPVEKDLVDSWVKELSDLEEGREIQLLPLSDLKYNVGLAIFMIDSEDRKKIEKYYPKGDACVSGSCICSIDLSSDKYIYCKSLKKYSGAKLTPTFSTKFFTLVSDPSLATPDKLPKRYFFDFLKGVQIKNDELIFDGDVRDKSTPAEAVEAGKRYKCDTDDEKLSYCTALSKSSGLQ